MTSVSIHLSLVLMTVPFPLKFYLNIGFHKYLSWSFLVRWVNWENPSCGSREKIFHCSFSFAMNLNLPASSAPHCCPNLTVSVQGLQHIPTLQAPHRCAKAVPHSPGRTLILCILSFVQWWNLPPTKTSPCTNLNFFFFFPNFCQNQNPAFIAYIGKIHQGHLNSILQYDPLASFLDTEVSNL